MRTFVEKILNAPAGSIVIRRPDIVMIIPPVSGKFLKKWVGKS